jgi:HAD superfamily hydrolase (TIGR01509 family)
MPSSTPDSGAFDAVIFDCDGVLVDSERLAVEVDQRVLADLGWRLSIEEIIERFVGGSHADFVAQVEHQLKRELEPDWDRAYAAWYRDAYAERLAPVPGVVDALAAIALPVAVASNGSRATIERNLRHVGLWDRFAGRAVSSQDVAAGKPAPDVFLLAAELLGVKPARCAAIEDSRVGVTAARAAGMRVFAFSGGLTKAEALAGANTVLFDDFGLLPGLLGL